MNSIDYIYQDRAVIFIDVLGFQEKLIEFEKEANDSALAGSEYLISAKVNEFISAFKDVIGLLDKDNLQYYLFSDNICITVDYVSNKNLLVNVLFTVSELFYSFAKKGYFLRGGIDVGKFVDERQIALGTPLSNAYKMESTDAVYPRILISKKYKSILDESVNNSLSSDSAASLEYLISDSCEFHYLNVFYNITRKDDRRKFLSDLRTSIIDNLETNKLKEKIFVKFSWLANEFNTFIDSYTTDIIFQDTDEIPVQEDIDEIKNLKISGYAI